MKINVKQIIVLALALAGIVVVIAVTPPYKMHHLGGDNYVITEATSPLYDRALGEVRRHWDRILPKAGGILLLSGILCFLLRNKRR